MNFIDLETQYQNYKQEIDAQIKNVIDNANFIMGKQIKEIEDKLAAYIGTKHAITCASGTDALLLALMAYDIQPDDEIITTPFTFIATAEVIAFLKAKPVYVDVDPKTYNIDPTKIEAAITNKTKGIIAVDIFGQCADYNEINAIAKKHNLFVIEDGAQSFGAKYKGKMACGLTEIGTTSFFPAKPFGCFGDGGMIFTNDDKKAEVMKSIRIHGKGGHKYDNIRIGVNARMDTIQAAVLLGKFPHFNQEVQDRLKIAKYYNSKLSNYCTTPFVKDDNLSVYAQYSIKIKNRDELSTFLNNAGIPTAIHYPKPLHLQTAFKYLGYNVGDFPVSEEVSNNIISLPMHPFLKESEQDLITDKIIEFINTSK